MTAQSLSPVDPSGTLIVVCGGTSEFVETALSQLETTPERIVLMAHGAGPLAARLGAVSDVTVLAGLPGGQAAQSDLIFYSLPGLSSLGAPTDALRALMPGLREVERTRVHRLDAGKVAHALSDFPQPFRIVIDVPGAESEILDAFAAAQILDRVVELRLRCGVERFFAGAEPSSAIAARLSERNFLLISEDSQDPDWPVLLFRADSIGEENRRLKTERDAALAERDRAVEVAFRLESSLNLVRADLERRGEVLADRDVELNDMRIALQRAEAALAEEQAAHAAARAERDTVMAELQRTSASLAQIEATHEAEKAESAARQAELSARQTGQSATEEEIVSMRAQVAASEQALAAARNDLAVALRLQALAQGDLRDLQGRFAEVEGQRRQQADLLKKLAPRLLLAADQLSHMIALPPPERAEPALPVVHAIAAKTRKKRGKSKKGKRR